MLFHLNFISKNVNKGVGSASVTTEYGFNEGPYNFHASYSIVNKFL